ncbi:MAG: carboxypeptidase-like regulatory domain-containing protein, partial [Acidobacteriota bacterium]
MKRNLNSVFILLTFILTLSLGALGQETTGSIEITSRDPNGAIVPNVSVTVATAVGGTSSSTGFKRTVNTGGDGYVRVLQVPPGDYSVTAAATAGFAVKTIQSV